jgi:acyl phosphate:glycerol-3-phosphate acyltransferase
MKPALLVLFSYLLGSIPFGYLLVRLRFGADIRETGSGGTGATNVSRRAGKLAGVLTLFLDALKGAAAVIITSKLLGTEANADWWIAASAIAVIVGHIFPVWLGFRGGKGVATGVGVFLTLTPWAVLAAFVLFVVIVLLTRYVSLGSIVATITIPSLILVRHLIEPVSGFFSLITATSVGALLIVFAHRENIGRLMAGTENRFR